MLRRHLKTGWAAWALIVVPQHDSVILVLQFYGESLASNTKVHVPCLRGGTTTQGAMKRTPSPLAEGGKIPLQELYVCFLGYYMWKVHIISFK
jgi:hypothetical protein